MLSYRAGRMLPGFSWPPLHLIPEMPESDEIAAEAFRPRVARELSFGWEGWLTPTALHLEAGADFGVLVRELHGWLLCFSLLCSCQLPFRPPADRDC